MVGSCRSSLVLAGHFAEWWLCVECSWWEQVLCSCVCLLCDMNGGNYNVIALYPDLKFCQCIQEKSGSPG